VLDVVLDDVPLRVRRNVAVIVTAKGVRVDHVPTDRGVVDVLSCGLAEPLQVQRAREGVVVRYSALSRHRDGVAVARQGGTVLVRRAVARDLAGPLTDEAEGDAVSLGRSTVVPRCLVL